MFRVAAMMAVMLLAVGGLVYGVMLAAQRSDVHRDLEWAATRSDVNSPPGCAWLVMVDSGGTLTETHGTPVGFPLRADIDAVVAGRPPIQREVTVDGTHYEVLTTWRGQTVVQAVYDLLYQQEDRASLLRSIAVAELAGMAGAAAVGGLLARRAMAPLAEALCKQRRFVADATHELRTPLTRLHTRAQLVSRRCRDLDLPDRVTADLNQLVTGSRELGAVIDDLLLSVQLRQAPQATSAVDVAQLVEDVARAEEPRVLLAWVALVVRRDDGPLLVDGVASALRRVVSALVDNAVGHTPPGGRITVSVTAPERSVVRLTVADTGVGIAPSEVERVFGRGTHGNTGSGRRFGIGLALVREVVEGHGGTVTATGAPGEGAVFTVELPALTPAAAVPAPRSTSDLIGRAIRATKANVT